MTDGGVPNDDMPNFLQPGRRDVVPVSDAALAALLAGSEPPAAPSPGLQLVADVLDALKAPATGDELAGEAMALAKFRRKGGMSAQPHQPRRRSPRVVIPLLRLNAASAAVIAAVGLGGLATAAIVGVLPAPVQRLAHETLGAPDVPGGPAKRLHPVQSNSPASPAELRAQHLCYRYERARAHGSAAERATALRSLLKAAGGADRAARYCGAAGARITPEARSSPSHPAPKRPPVDRSRPPGRQHHRKGTSGHAARGGHATPSTGHGRPHRHRHSHGNGGGTGYSDLRAAGGQRAH